MRKTQRNAKIKVPHEIPFRVPPLEVSKGAAPRKQHQQGSVWLPGISDLVMASDALLPLRKEFS